MESENYQQEQKQEDRLKPENTAIDQHHNGLQTEVDLSDHDSHDDMDEFHPVDYTSFSKEAFVKLIKELSHDDNFKKVDRVLREIKPLFEACRKKERQQALKIFMEQGGSKEDFDYKGKDEDIEFDANVKLIKDRKAKFLKNQEDKKSENLRVKEELLEKLRELVDGVDTDNPFETFKELQKEWKETGAVPAAQARTIWANYHALVDRYYDNQSIYFELKELDRKKNLESKVELCERAEKLAEVEIIKDAVKELNELHHEFKHIGPVPVEDKEAVWVRFKAASDAVYARRDAYLQNLQQELGENLDKKLRLCEEVEQFTSFQSDRIKEWNQKTKEVLDVQKKWEAIGGLPRAKAREVNKKFWGAFKAFFTNKNAFFKQLDQEREKNLQQKAELVLRAQELKDSTDWDATANELKGLQTKWKEIGPVPEKHRDRIFKEFKEACDHFFNQKRHQLHKQGDDQVQNMEQKLAICAALEKHTQEGTVNEDLLSELQEKFDSIGFVPRRELQNVRSKFMEAVEKFVAKLPDKTDEDRTRILMEVKISGLKGDPNADRKIFQKEQAIRKKISKVENDLALWRNNLEFFGSSKNADKVKSEFNDKIQAADDQLRQLKEQLKLLRTVS